MTYKMIAIGVLALLALSSVMNPKAFRFLTGFLAVAIVTLATGYFVLASYSPTPESVDQSGVARLISRLRSFVRGQPSWNDTARSTSQRILEGFENDLIQTIPADDVQDEQGRKSTSKRPIIVIERHRVEKANIGPDDRKEQAHADILARLLAIVEQYLQGFKGLNPSPELARVRPEDLNLTLLNFQPKRQRKNGTWEFTVVFDEAFNQHVRDRARQLKIKDRLIAATYACLAIGVALCFLFGVLKVINSRRRVQPEKDLLRLSQVSIV